MIKERGRSRGGKVVSQLPCNKNYCILANLWPHLPHKNLLRCKDHQVGHSLHTRLGDYVVHIWGLILLWVYTPTKGRGREGARGRERERWECVRGGRGEQELVFPHLYSFNSTVEAVHHSGLLGIRTSSSAPNTLQLEREGEERARSRKG